jgi:hypothetical protein
MSPSAVTQEVVDNLTRPIPKGGAGLGAPLPALSHPELAPPKLKTVPLAGNEELTQRPSARNQPTEVELAQQLQSRLAEGDRLQEALGRNTIELNGLRDQLARDEQQLAHGPAEPAPARKTCCSSGRSPPRASARGTGLAPSRPCWSFGNAIRTITRMSSRQESTSRTFSSTSAALPRLPHPQPKTQGPPPSRSSRRPLRM